MQHHRVVSWLSQHNFPHGLVSFADGLSTDPLGHKAAYLNNLIQVLTFSFSKQRRVKNHEFRLESRRHHSFRLRKQQRYKRLHVARLETETNIHRWKSIEKATFPSNCFN